MNADTNILDEAAELRRCLRDVLGLLALPAIWRGRSPREILVSLSEAIEATMDVDVLVASARSADGTMEVVRIRGAEDAARAHEAREWFAPFSASSASAVKRLTCGDLGSVAAVHEPLAYHAVHGHVVVGSGRSGFPSATELAIIRAATALTTTALETSRAMREREEAIRAKDDFLAVLGHELRNPLAPIASALDILRHRKDGQFSPEEQIIERQVEHLRRLVDDLLDVARITRGAIELQCLPVELAHVVDDAAEAAASLIEEKRHSLHVDVPRSGLTVNADRFRLAQVIVNLLTNSARYTPPGGRIEIEAAARNQRIVLSVRDNGIGIAPELLPRIFHQFVQGRHAYDAQYGGLGIGLALVHNFVALHGGEVRVTSEGTGRGSQFDVELPLVPDASVAPLPRPPGRDRISPARPRRVLIVDDNVDAGELLGEALTIAGHHVRVVDNPLVAVDVAVDFAAEIVVLDLGMPLLDGYAVAAQIRERLRDSTPPLIALTGYGQAGDRAKTKAAGFDEHFVKPVDLTRLVARIAELCPA